ncbi:MAG: cell division protein FtsA, partial [Bacteroidaceae bacterium]|nr:cell division protein FtsA [Bacteroidaceae bacterium]
MANEKFTVALEIGSSKITAVAGTKQPDGAIQVLAIAQEDSGSFIRKGRILNIDKMTQCIKSIKDKLEKRLNRQINKAYVGVGGMGMHTLLNCINRTFPETTKVTEDMIDELRDENIQTAPAGYEIIDVIEQEYQLGTMSSTEPVGTLTSNLKGQFLNVVTRASVRKQIEDVFYNIGINVIEIPVSFLALANATLKDNERQSGCVFVDMGAQTTSVAVFKGNILRHAAILPIGGWNITNDIAQTLQISLEEAENLKLKHDFAI